jgi:hypothetical protein
MLPTVVTKSGIPPRRQERKERCLSFRPTGEIFLRSLVFPRDDGLARHLAPFAPLRETQFFAELFFIQNFKCLWLVFRKGLMHWLRPEDKRR